MSTRHFCDRCDQQLIEPDENVNFITGQPTSANEDVCWRCRLQEIVDLYNEKTKGWEQDTSVFLFSTHGLTDTTGWTFSVRSRRDNDAEP